MDPFGIDYITSHKRGVPYAYKVLFKRIAAVAGSLDTILSVPTASEDDVSLYKALHRKWLAVFVEEEPSFGRERVYRGRDGTKVRYTVNQHIWVLIARMNYFVERHTALNAEEQRLRERHNAPIIDEESYIYLWSMRFAYSALWQEVWHDDSFWIIPVIRYTQRQCYCAILYLVEAFHVLPGCDVGAYFVLAAWCVVLWGF